jgi:CRP-like cAMP-binding protein
MLNRTEEPERVSEDEKFTTLRQGGFSKSSRTPNCGKSFARADGTTTHCVPKHCNRAPSKALFVIVSGAVAVTKRGTQITTLISGGCLGEMAYLSATARSAAIIAQDDVSLLKVTASLMSHASLSCQLRFNRRFLDTLFAQLTRASAALSRK